MFFWILCNIWSIDHLWTMVIKLWKAVDYAWWWSAKIIISLLPLLYLSRKGKNTFDKSKFQYCCATCFWPFPWEGLFSLDSSVVSNKAAINGQSHPTNWSTKGLHRWVQPSCILCSQCIPPPPKKGFSFLIGKMLLNFQEQLYLLWSLCLFFL